MTTSVALVNGLLGIAYLGIGGLVVIDLVRGWRTLGFSPFGAALAALAFTCGPHHLDHAIHIMVEGRVGGPLDLIAVVFGLPAGAAFVYLRTEAFFGGRGDRTIQGTPPWMKTLPTIFAMYLTAIVFAGVIAAASGLGVPLAVYPNVALLGVYTTIGYFLLRTQLRNRSTTGAWSVSGLSLMAIFPTCVVMHSVYILYAMTGQYGPDVHGLVIDWVSVPAGLYFLWIVRGLYRDTIRDWNRTFADSARLEVAA